MKCMCGNEADVEGGICKQCRDKFDRQAENRTENAMFLRRY